MVAVPQDDLEVEVDDSDTGRVRALPAALADTVVPWIRFVGPGRLLGAAGAALVLAGMAWWMLRAPAAPTESRLPLAARAEAGQVVTSAASSGLSPHPSAPPTTAVVVVIHVTGAVQSPGVYELQPGQRVADAIVAAGGALADADADALNLAAPVADGDRIAVPLDGESPAMTGAVDIGHSHAVDSSAEGVAGVPINVNTAGVAELETLPGIGPATAAAIVEHREHQGPYATIDDLEAVRGIGPAKLEAIRDHVTL